MLLKTLTTGITAAIAFSASADNLVDPAQLLTHEVYSNVQILYWENTDLRSFEPASTAAECAHAVLYNSSVDSYMGVTNQCESSGSSIDVIKFDWHNHFMPHAGHSTTGLATSIFSSSNDAEISLSQISNLNLLDTQANWNISLYDENSSHIGDLNYLNSSIDIFQDVCYELVFSIGGQNTQSYNNSTITWNIQIEYSQESSGGGASAVPGFGGLALLGGLGAVRRRRRH